MRRSNFRAPRIAIAAALALLTSALVVGCRSAAPASEAKPLAPRLEGMGNHRFAITTEVPDAQAFFDQGLVLAYGFNHAEAARSFDEAARLDPTCAICFWGKALVAGPNINAGMDDAAVPEAFADAQVAQRLSAAASTREQALIEALATRYVAEPVEDRSALDQTYAEAMRVVAERFPEDDDALTLLAEALMDLHPWDFWQAGGAPQPWTPEILALLERVLARTPDHPGANHLYIHAVEASTEPSRAESAADRLAHLVPGAGHLVHMPSHIYIRVGRYRDASEANERAIAADDAYVTQCHAQGIYPLAYMPHNRHFLWAAATMEGRGQVAIDTARAMADGVDQEMMRAPGMGTLQHFWITPLYALSRFGRWQEVLDTERPPEDLPYPTAVWHYARGLAMVAGDRLDEAEAELASLRTVMTDPDLESVTVWDINGSLDLLAIAADVLVGELAASRGDVDAALTHLEAALAREDALRYDEPPTWHHPVGQILGAVLLDSGQPERAEAVYRQELHKHPENGWSLFGLAESVRAQGRSEEADQLDARFALAWARADVTLEASRML